MGDWFDADGIDMDNMSIDLGDIIAMLNGDNQGNTEGFMHGEPPPSQIEKPFSSKTGAESTTGLENVRGKGHFQLNLEAASNSNREMGSGFLPEHGGHLDCITDSETHALLNSSQDSDNWLWSSHTNSNFPVIAPGGSSFFHSNFEQPQLQNNIGQFVAPRKSVKESDFICDPVALPVNGCYFNSETWGNEHWELKSSFQNEYKELRPNADNICSPFNLQNGEPGSSYVFSQENFGYSDGMHSSISSSVLPDSEVEDGNMYPSLPISSRIDPHTFVHNAVHPVANTFDSINNTSDGSNSLTLTRDYTADAEFGIDQTGTANFPPFYSYNTEKLDRSESTVFASQNSHWINQSTLSTKEESPDSNSPDDYLDVSAPDELCSDYNHSDDMSLISESSTDSSSLPSSRTSMSDNVEGCVVNSSNHMVSGSETIWSSKPKPSVRGERGDHLHHGVLRGGSSAVQKNITRSSTSSEHDTDLCIIDDTSDLICLPTPPARPNLNTISKRSEVSDAHYSGVGGMGFRANDERSTIRRVLQDFSQRKSEANPPDGVLAVPLLKHQRIALSWMVQMETGVGSCSGGILADDQGLGKTVSTIALILTERSPSSRSLTVLKKEDEFKALNLDAGDDDDDDEVSVIKQPRNSIDMKTSKPVKKECPVTVVRGRPAAGTLVVCPTSVLRQWADELQTKVTTEANLSFLVYHGSNRTKDPGELAKFDVVLTTYAIVSMEVPKQPLVDKDDEEKGKRDISGMSSGVFNSKKRKDHPTSIVKNMKGRGTPDGAMLDSTARPLGRVAWFRVILDEAQSIKNHRTQVARACWGLRAKRRWCLSGTPIQNSVDDLYSYFRFLKYDPFAVYQSFCSKIKIPISKNPTKGFKKLQLVLRTIMLRRTKGTTLDGKPIIILPPKKISLKKVDFSMKERAFYSRLEAESREQYMEYEFAGTVKQNYVNILLMLLRLRQACDHPLLVKGCNSDSSQTSSMEMTMKLPKDKRVILLSRLEVSLAICTICNDPPEDAVVTICGHVFCNQCICQHLTTEENVCPSPDCKVHLSSASVFSRQTLKNSLSDELGGGNYSGSCSDVGMEVKHKKSEYNWSSYSSKIKAALEILQSLPRSQCHSSSNVDKSDGESSSSSVCQANDVQGRSSVDSSSIKCIGLDKCSNTNASEKAIIFSQWTGMLDLLETPLKASGIQYRRLDGTMSITARDKAVKDFKTLPEITVIIMSLKAASLGLNLVAANHVILLDLWWNPTTEDQAIDRAHRIGQTRPVSVSRLTVKDTVEDKILNLQQKKREMVASAFGENESGSRQMRLTEDDLRYLFNP